MAEPPLAVAQIGLALVAPHKLAAHHLGPPAEHHAHQPTLVPLRHHLCHQVGADAAATGDLAARARQLRLHGLEARVEVEPLGRQLVEHQLLRRARRRLLLLQPGHEGRQLLLELCAAPAGALAAVRQLLAVLRLAACGLRLARGALLVEPRLQPSAGCPRLLRLRHAPRPAEGLRALELEAEPVGETPVDRFEQLEVHARVDAPVAGHRLPQRLQLLLVLRQPLAVLLALALTCCVQRGHRRLGLGPLLAEIRRELISAPLRSLQLHLEALHVDDSGRCGALLEADLLRQLADPQAQAHLLGLLTQLQLETAVLLLNVSCELLFESSHL